MVSLSRKRISADFGGNIFWITQCHNMCQKQWPIKISTCSMYLLLCNFIEHLPKHEGQKTTLKDRERETAWAEHVTPSSFFWFSFNFWMFFITGHKISKNAVVVQLPHHVQFFATHGLQHARSPCPSPSPGVCPSSCSLHRWCHPAISSSDALLSFCPQSLPASGTVPTSSHQMTKILELQLQHQSFQWIFKVDPT